jgi:hypothetical protein
MSKSKRPTNNGKNAHRRTSVPTTALAKSVRFDDHKMWVTLIDGRVLGVPLLWSSRLSQATRAQRNKYGIGGHGISRHWPALDEDLSVANLLAGGDRRST